MGYLGCWRKPSLHNSRQRPYHLIATWFADEFQGDLQHRADFSAEPYKHAVTTQTQNLPQLRVTSSPVLGKMLSYRDGSSGSKPTAKRFER